MVDTPRRAATLSVLPSLPVELGKMAGEFEQAEMWLRLYDYLAQIDQALNHASEILDDLQGMEQ